ncbi:hypothetical protein EDD11_005246 [Mortierella claussenii]|nr:hypothetical protein EDD11_005246 [Mortierella claussenii]
MYALFPHPSSTSARRQFYPTSYSSPAMYTPYTIPAFEPVQDDSDSYDEEEQLLMAALERKRQQKLARQQYQRQQLLEQQRQKELIEQRRQQQLIEQELLARRRRAQAIAQAQYEAEQEAIRQYKKQQQQIRQQALLENLFLQHIQRQQQAEEQERKEAAAVAAAAAAAKAKAAAKTEAAAKQKQIAQQAAADASTAANEEKETGHIALSDLLNAIFFPQSQLKRHQSQEQQYPCKRRQQQQQEQEKKQEQEQKQKQIELQKQEEALARKEQEKKNKDTTASKSKTDNGEDGDEDLIGNYFLTFPDVKSMVEAALGAKLNPSAHNKVEPAVTKPTESKTTTAPSSTNSSPELRAADILKQRQTRQQQQPKEQTSESKQDQQPIDPIKMKHSELNSIDSVLDSLSNELDQILIGTIENKKQILLTEENLTKTMLRLDSIQSDGDASVRKHRKQLIKKSQAMLNLVDEFKARDANPADKKMASESKVDAPTSETDIDYTLCVSDMEPLPDTTNDDVAEEDEKDEIEDSSEQPSTSPAPESTQVTVTEPARTEESVTEIEPTETEIDHGHEHKEPELTHDDDSGSSADEEEPKVSKETKIDTAAGIKSKPNKAVDPLELIADAALDLTRAETMEHDFEMVAAH